MAVTMAAMSWSWLSWRLLTCLTPTARVLIASIHAAASHSTKAMRRQQHLHRTPVGMQMLLRQLLLLLRLLLKLVRLPPLLLLPNLLLLPHLCVL